MVGTFFQSVSSGDLLPELTFLISFLMGSIPFGIIVARVGKRGDLKSNESGKVATPISSAVAAFWPAGFIVFALDVTKGSLAVLLAMPLGSRFLEIIFSGSSDVESVVLSPVSVWMAGFIAIVGHCFSPWLHFKGGKGVATGLGVILILSPISALFGVLGFVLTFLHRRIVSLASIAGLILAAVAYLVFNSVGAHLWVGAAIVYLILFRHEASIDALLENREEAIH